MKTQISRDSFHPAQRYSGVYLQQGRMILDADWNELTDIQKARLVEALRDAIGGGAPREGGLSIATLANKVQIHPGMLYVEGVPARFDSADGQPAAILAQPDYPLPKPVRDGYVETNLRFYADVWERSLSALHDPTLLDAGLHGADTATRSLPTLQIKWCAKSKNPLKVADNPAIGDATLSLALRSIASDGDACDPCASQVSVNERIGNYLFRVEVHDYQNGWLTLKWSRDNGAEACAADAAPPGFKQGDWVWEFFDDDSERLLGNQLFRGQDWAGEYYAAGDVQANAFIANPSKFRGILRESAELPPTDALPDGAVPDQYLRQWDGYLRIHLASQALHGLDRGVALVMGTAADDSQKKQKHGRVFLDDSLHINLERMVLNLAIQNRQFVAGDYWQAEVREAQDESGDEVLDDALPRGVQHHYLFLGEQDGSTLEFGELDGAGALIEDSEDAYRRRMNFPPLTDLHADEIGFIDRCEKLFEGAQNVQQALDNLCHISASDIAFTDTCDGLFDGATNVQDALTNLCDIGAEDIAYRLPECEAGDSLKAQLAEYLPADAEEVTIEATLDALLCHLDAASLPYSVPDCVGDNDVGDRLGLTAGEATQVGPLLDKLLCEFTADELPLDKTDPELCPSLLSPDIVSVQDAIDLICKTPAACAITVAVGQLEEILRKFAANTKQTNLWLCLQPGEHTINGQLDILGKANLRLSGLTASATRIRLSKAPTVLEAGELIFENLGWIIDADARLTLRGQRISSERCNYNRTATSPDLPPMLLLQTWDLGLKQFNLTPELFWHDNTLKDTWLRYVPLDKTVFTPEITGEILVADKIKDLFGDPVTLFDSSAFEAKVQGIAEIIAAMPAEKIQVWGNNLVTAPTTAPGATPGITPAVELIATRSLTALDSGANTRTLRSPSNNVSRINIGTPTVEAAKPQVATAVSGIGAANGNVAIIGELLADAILATTIERGFGVALALADNQLSGSLCDNHMEGELLLMNGLADGIDPRAATLNKRAVEGNVVSGQGNLTLSGNRLERLWSWLPKGSIANNTLLQTVPGYESLTLAGNQLTGYGHSWVGGLLTVQGNRFLNGPPKGPTYIGKCFANGAALSANAASFADEFTPLMVVTGLMEAAANLLLADQV